MESFLAVLYANGYLILLLAAAINSAMVAIMGGVAAHAGHISIITGLLFLVVGGSIFNQAYFYLGKRSSDFFHKGQHKLNQQKANKITTLIKKHGTPFIFIYRFLPGIRFVSPFIIGATLTRLSQLKFLILDMIASVIWSCVFFGIGLACGEVAKKLFTRFEHYENAAFVVIIIAFIIWFVIKKTVQYKRTGSIWRKNN